MQRQRHQFRLHSYRTPAENIAAIYDRAGDDYLAYADGDPKHLFSFDGLHGYADQRVWSLLDTQLSALRATGADSVRILDAGCGPGTWLRRIVTRGHQLGFTHITARGFDIAQEQIRSARGNACELAALPGVDLTFDIGDLADRLPEADASVDISCCLYSVLSHLPVAILPRVAAEMARVTRGHFITTVRAVGSTPTIFVDSIDKARWFRLDHRRDCCDIELSNGHRMSLKMHLFSAGELASRFGRHFEIEELCGLDIFHNRFAPDRRWNPASCQDGRQLSSQLAILEETFAHDPSFMERATHLLLVGRPNPISPTGLHVVAGEPASRATAVASRP